MKDYTSKRKNPDKYIEKLKSENKRIWAIVEGRGEVHSTIIARRNAEIEQLKGKAWFDCNKHSKYMTRLRPYNTNEVHLNQEVVLTGYIDSLKNTDNPIYSVDVIISLTKVRLKGATE